MNLPRVVLIHGPLSGLTKRTVARSLSALEKGYVSDVIVSTYNKEVAEAEDMLRAAGTLHQNASVIGSEDVRNPGFANVNRQVNLVRAGLPERDSLVIKLRSDQLVDFRRLAALLDKYESRLQAGAILTTNCFTRVDRAYHPSDMFMVGMSSSLKEYFPEDGFWQTELDDQLAIRAAVAAGHKPFLLDQWPEARLFRQYIAKKGWHIRETQGDSFEAIKEWCVLVDARQVGLRWEKFFGGKLTLVPYRFTMEPFKGGPMETARCYRASAFGTCSRSYSAVTQLMTLLIWNRLTLAYRRYGSWRGTAKALLRKSAFLRTMRGRWNAFKLRRL